MSVEKQIIATPHASPPKRQIELLGSAELIHMDRRFGLVGGPGNQPGPPRPFAVAVIRGDSIEAAGLSSSHPNCCSGNQNAGSDRSLPPTPSGRDYYERRSLPLRHSGSAG